jgi:hypothetical protein
MKWHALKHGTEVVIVVHRGDIHAVGLDDNVRVDEADRLLFHHRGIGRHRGRRFGKAMAQNDE